MCNHRTCQRWPTIPYEPLLLRSTPLVGPFSARLWQTGLSNRSYPTQSHNRQAKGRRSKTGQQVDVTSDGLPQVVELLLQQFTASTLLASHLFQRSLVSRPCFCLLALS